VSSSPQIRGNAQFQSQRIAVLRSRHYGTQVLFGGYRVGVSREQEGGSEAVDFRLDERGPGSDQSASLVQSVPAHLVQPCDPRCIGVEDQEVRLFAGGPRTPVFRECLLQILATRDGLHRVQREPSTTWSAAELAKRVPEAEATRAIVSVECDQLIPTRQCATPLPQGGGLG
jgi:hypothetical protein